MTKADSEGSRWMAASIAGRAWFPQRAKLGVGLGVAMLGILLAGCGDVVQSDEPESAGRPNVENVQTLEPAAASRADEYRATATALASTSRSAGVAPTGPETEEYSEIFQRLRMPAANHIAIPSLGIDAPVEDVGTELKNGTLVWQVIENIVGHHRASANPGEPGNIVLTGHVESRSSGNVFLNLPGIQVGDEVTVSSPAGEFTYVVTAVEILHESEVGVLGHGFDEKLTLITCVPDGIYDHRVIVTALPAEMAASG
jgi:LPXTG-site transpeptidase (sortase) family protein